MGSSASKPSKEQILSNLNQLIKNGIAIVSKKIATHPEYNAFYKLKIEGPLKGQRFDLDEKTINSFDQCVGTLINIHNGLQKLQKPNARSFDLGEIQLAKIITENVLEKPIYYLFEEYEKIRENKGDKQSLKTIFQLFCRDLGNLQLTPAGKKCDASICQAIRDKKPLMDTIRQCRKDT